LQSKSITRRPGLLPHPNLLSQACAALRGNN